MTDERKNVAYTLIDPPVGPYSTPDEIRRWIDELESMPWVEGLSQPLEQARNWLDMEQKNTGPETR